MWAIIRGLSTALSDQVCCVEPSDARTILQAPRSLAAVGKIPKDRNGGLCAVSAFPACFLTPWEREHGSTVAAVILAGDAELAAEVRMVINEVKEARLRQDQERGESRPPMRSH